MILILFLILLTLVLESSIHTHLLYANSMIKLIETEICWMLKILFTQCWDQMDWYKFLSEYTIKKEAKTQQTIMLRKWQRYSIQLKMILKICKSKNKMNLSRFSSQKVNQELTLFEARKITVVKRSRIRKMLWN